MTETATTFKIELGCFSNEFALVKTTTPKAYDYGYAIEVYGEDRDERFVLIPVDKLEYQMGRYLSGGFAAVEDPCDSVIEWITERLYAKLMA